MEKGNEEILKKAVAKDYGKLTYQEMRIEYSLRKLLELDPEISILLDAGYKLNNILIPGYKDIGIDGQAVFILRIIKEK